MHAAFVYMNLELDYLVDATERKFIFTYYARWHICVQTKFWSTNILFW